jgi:hypothetical protein
VRFRTADELAMIARRAARIGGIAMDYPYQIPGTTGPQIVIRPGVFDLAVLADGVPLRGRGTFRKIYMVPMADGSARELRLNMWGGRLRARVDGTDTPIGRQASTAETVVALLPVGLGAIGGGLGALIGGVAVGMNLAIVRGNEAAPIRVLSMVATTVAAVFIWWGALTLIRSMI